MNEPANTFILNLSREAEKIRISAYEKISGEEQTLKHYEDHAVSFIEIEKLCKEIVTLLNRANRRGDITPEIINDLKKAGQTLYDELLTPRVKNLLRSTLSETLVLYIDDQLVHIPWELLFDGQEFLCLKFCIGRIVSTRQGITGIQKREKSGLLKMLIVADPQGNLDAAYKEGIKIRDELRGHEDAIKGSLVSSKVDIQYIKKNIRDFDIVHYAGHADYDLKEPSQSGWVLSDGKWTSSDIAKMAGGAPLPFLIFSNACHSGRTGEWRISEGFEKEIYGLANAFLLSGVTHYIGTFWEILDSPSSVFAIEFYKALGENASVGSAIRIARKQLIELFGENTIIWASYMLYGDPTYKILDKASHEKMDQLAGAAQETSPSETGFSHKMDTLRSSGAESNIKPQKNFSKVFYGILAVVILIFLFLGIKGLIISTKKQKPSIEPQQAITSSKIIPLELSMNIIGQREESDGSVSEVIIKEASILHSYDNFQIHFTTNKDAFVYILIFDSANEAHLLFPDPKIPLSNNIKGVTEYSVPTAGKWFWLDENTGIETIYVLASETPLNDIAGLLKEMEGVNTQKKKGISTQIKDKINILERGVGGITEGNAKSFYLKDGKKIQSVTEIVKGTEAVVRAISFRHIDRSPFKDFEVFSKDKKKTQKGRTTDNTLIRNTKLSSANLDIENRKGIASERTISKALQNVKRNITLEESRGVGGIQVYKEASPTVVLIVTNDEIGSGSMIDRQGHIITNWHVVQGYSKVAVVFKPEKGVEVKKENAFAAKVIKLDEVSDLALLKIERLPEKTHIIKLGSMDNVEVAQEVHAIGHPDGEIWTYTKGIISQIRPDYEWSYDDKIMHKSKVIQTQTPINPGNSGGPLLNDEAELIGINSFVKQGEGLNYAVSVDVVQDFLKRKESRISKKASVPGSLKDLDYQEFDVNKDGITDALGIDTNKNGKLDTFIIDKNQDGKPDYFKLDTDENGKFDTIAYDTNNNKKLDTWAYDTNEDGKLDLYGYDYDEDGEIDEYKES